MSEAAQCNSSQNSPDLSSWGKAGWLAALAAVPLLRALSIWLESDWWGLNQTFFVPKIYSLTWLGLILALFLLSFLRPVGDACQKIERGFWSFVTEGRGAIIVATLVGVISLGLGVDSFLFADGYARISALVNSDITYVHPFEFVATYLAVVFYKLAGALSERPLDGGALVLRLLGAMSAVGSFWLWLKISASLGKTSSERTAALAMLSLTGATLLFTGVGELFSPAVFLISLIIWLAIVASKSSDQDSERKANRHLAIAILLSPLLLAQMVFLYPALVFIVGLKPSRPTQPGRARGLAFVGVLLGLVGIIYWYSTTDLWVSARLVGLTKTPPEFEYGLLSLSRLADLVNTEFALWPLFPAFIALYVRFIWNDRCDRMVGSLSALAVSAGVWIAISDFPVGSTRAIVSLAPFALAPAALAAYLWNKRVARAGSGAGPQTLNRALVLLGVLSLALSAPVYLRGEYGVKYLDHDYQQRSKRYYSGLVNFRDHYFFHEQYSTADRWEWNFKSRAPEYLDYLTVQTLFKQRDYTGALNRLSFLLSTNPHWGKLQAARASALLALGQPEQALVSSREALQLSPSDPAIHITEGDALRQLGRLDDADRAYRTALESNPTDDNALARLATLSYNRQDYLRARRMALLTFEANPINPYSYLVIGLMALDGKDYLRARKYLLKSAEMGGNFPEAGLIRQSLREIAQAVQIER